MKAPPDARSVLALTAWLVAATAAATAAERGSDGDA